MSAPSATILEQAPAFELRAVGVDGDERSVSLHGYAGRWLVLFLAVGRSPSEVLRVLEALRTGAHSPAEWRAGDPTLRG